MDENVLASIARWPDVPAAYGWLSLSPRGEWRLHPLGDAAAGGAGVGISNPQILGFIGRNYARQNDGAYFFQNGPQRVFVRIDAAPYVIHCVPEQGKFFTQNGIEVKKFHNWLIDEAGQLYAQTDIGPSRIDDRDLMLVTEHLMTREGTPLLNALDEAGFFNSLRGESESVLEIPVLPAKPDFPALTDTALLRQVTQETISLEMGFIANPKLALK